MFCDLLDELEVLVIVNKNERGITLNLRAPVVIHLSGRMRAQVVANGDQPLQYELNRDVTSWKKIA